MKKRTGKKAIHKPDWKNNSTLRIVLITVIIISLGTMMGVITYTITKNSQYNSNIITVKIINTSVEVKVDGFGLNADTDALKYGKVSPGRSGTRSINISTKERAIVNVYIYGQMADFLSIDQNTFVMDPETYKLVTFNLNIPANTTPGNYAGQIRIELLRS